MKKIHNTIISIICFILFSGLVYASATIASNNKSTYLPWQGIPLGDYDGAHNVGVDYLPQTRFTDNGDGTTSDGVTRLMWQKGGDVSIVATCVAKDTIANTADDRFFPGDNASRCREASPVYGNGCNWCAAMSYCEDLILGGQTDWRLPNIKELTSIVDLTRDSPALDTSFFTSENNYYWSSTLRSDTITGVWLFNPSYGHTYRDFKPYHYYVRCVR